MFKQEIQQLQNSRVFAFFAVQIRFPLLHAACSAFVAQALEGMSIHKSHTGGGLWGKANGLTG